MNWMEKSSFHYKGRDKRGVHQWTGSWNTVLKWVGIPFCVYGGFAAIGLIVILLTALITGKWESYFTTLSGVAGIHAITFGATGYWSLWMRRRIQALSPPDQASERLGISHEELQDLATERGIKPRMVINGEDFYDLADFDPALTLVRASQQPGTTSDTLLRPASSSSPSNPEELLRPDEQQINRLQ